MPFYHNVYISAISQSKKSEEYDSLPEAYIYIERFISTILYKSNNNKHALLLVEDILNNKQFIGFAGVKKIIEKKIGDRVYVAADEVKVRTNKAGWDWLEFKDNNDTKGFINGLSILDKIPFIKKGIEIKTKNSYSIKFSFLKILEEELHDKETKYKISIIEFENKEENDNCCWCKLWKVVTTSNESFFSLDILKRYLKYNIISHTNYNIPDHMTYDTVWDWARYYEDQMCSKCNIQYNRSLKKKKEKLKKLDKILAEFYQDCILEKEDVETCNFYEIGAVPDYVFNKPNSEQKLEDDYIRNHILDDFPAFCEACKQAPCLCSDRKSSSVYDD